MNSTIQPYLFFEGRTEEAIEFYKKAVGLQVVVAMRFKDSPEKGDCPPPPGSENKIMHATVTIGGSPVMMSDGRCSGAQKFDGFALSINAKDEAEAKKFFGALSEGGNVMLPISKTFFSDAFGMTSDKFGVMWMVIVPKPMG